MNPLRTAVVLCDDITAATMDRPVLKWTWGPALLGFALAQLDDHLRQPRYRPWLERYFPAMYGRASGDAELLDVAARQPGLYAERLLDPATGLWHHCYWVRSCRPFPDVFWGRGNGWVVAALPMILDQLDTSHPQRGRILELLGTTSAALLPLQAPDGTWSTVLADKRRWRPARGGYRELSATALVASGWLHAVRAGYLAKGFQEPAERALAAVSGGVRRRAGRLELLQISGPTIPVPVFPRLGYLWTPTGANHPYGVAAFVLAAINWDRLHH